MMPGRACKSALTLFVLSLWWLAGAAAPAPLPRAARAPHARRVTLHYFGTVWDVRLYAGGRYRAAQLRGGRGEDWWAPVYVGTWRPGGREGEVVVRERYAGTRATPTDWAGPCHEFTAGAAGPVRIERGGR